MVLRFSSQYISYISQSSEKKKRVYAPRPGKRTIEACKVFANIKDSLLSFQVVPVVVHVVLQYRFFIITRDMTSIFVAGSVC